MTVRHTVKQGETIASIAHDSGFSHFETIWNHPENAELKAKRASPDVLLPGDLVVVPDKESKVVTVATGREHPFVLRRHTVLLRLALVDLVGEPMADASCDLIVDGKRSKATADGNGVVEIRVSPSTREVTLSVDGQEQLLEVGALDPAREVTGWQGRLRNLGHYFGPIGEESDASDAAFGLRSFQADNDLDTTGQPDDSTLAKLVEVHGS
jgi:hypothetical protein